MVKYQFALVSCLRLLIVLQVEQMRGKLETRFGGADFVHVQWRAAVSLLLEVSSLCSGVLL